MAEYPKTLGVTLDDLKIIKQYGLKIPYGVFCLGGLGRAWVLKTQSRDI